MKEVEKRTGRGEARIEGGKRKCERKEGTKREIEKRGIGRRGRKTKDRLGKFIK